MSNIRHIPLSQGKFAQVDECHYDYLMQWTWHAAKAHKTYYARRSQGRAKNALAMHHVVLGLKLGRPLADGELPDHRNGDGLCNTEENLRVADHAQNMRNRRTSNESGYRGFSLIAGEYKASIRVNGVGKPLGSYETAEEAARAYDAAARYHHGEFASTNFDGDEAMSYEQVRAKNKQDNLARRRAACARLSGYTGVVLDKRSGRFIATLSHKGKAHHVGSYATELEAAIARDDYLIKLMGPLASPLNFPERGRNE